MPERTAGPFPAARVHAALCFEPANTLDSALFLGESQLISPTMVLDALTALERSDGLVVSGSQCWMRVATLQCVTVEGR